MKRTISISAKCSDLFTAMLREKSGDEINSHYVGEYQGYVPDFFPGNHYGDYVELEIDVETGQILNWKKPTKKDLKIFVAE